MQFEEEMYFGYPQRISSIVLPSSCKLCLYCSVRGGFTWLHEHSL